MQTEGKNLIWFEEIERKLAKLSRLPLLTVLPLNYFMGTNQGSGWVWDVTTRRLQRNFSLLLSRESPHFLRLTDMPPSRVNLHIAANETPREERQRGR
jgi:hypothetical protein